MIVDTTTEDLTVIVVFERPKTVDMQNKLDYILDTLSELEADYHYENTN